MVNFACLLGGALGRQGWGVTISGPESAGVSGRDQRFKRWT